MATQKKLVAEDALKVILQRALLERASDVHIEPLSSVLRIRFRIDGILQERMVLPLHEYETILNRIEVASNITLVRHTTPIEGHFAVNVDQLYVASKVEEAPSSSPISDKFTSIFGGKADAAVESSPTTAHLFSIIKEMGIRFLDLRVSIFPTVNGEVTVLRILNRLESLSRLDDLGMNPDDLKVMKKLIARTYGMVLVTGPAGAGKTTTLYSVLQSLKSKEKNIITLEDPVEFRFEDMRQSEIKPELNYTFAEGMRSILRQDPDVIMIGEIRDADTAEQTVRASLTGRIVFSTVHSNTTIGTIARFIDMNVERSLIAYALNGVISQRLVRKICTQCKEVYVPDQEYLVYFGINENSFQFVKGKGCAVCQGTGYHGRTGIFEVLEIDNTLRSLIIDKSPMSALQDYVESKGFRALKQAALEKVYDGTTTLEEAARAV